MQILHIMHARMAFRSSHPVRKYDHKNQADLTAKIRVTQFRLSRQTLQIVYRSFRSCRPTHAKPFII